MSQVDGYDWPDESLVPVDGQPHTLSVSQGRTAMMWTYEADSAPDCTIADAYDGDPLPLQPTEGAYRREGGSAGDWIGTATLQPTSSTVEVTCSGLDPRSRSLVVVADAPRMPPALAAFGALVAIPVGLGLTGLLALGAATVLALRPRPSRCL
ncbi:MAG: hypothetical protein JWO11_4175 [Nocardioides sp.]|nr:hypothetical protein [Nocardioides sp.]